MKYYLFVFSAVTFVMIPSVTWAGRKDPQLDALTQQLVSVRANPSNSVELAYYLQNQAQLAIQAVLDASSREKDAYLAIAKERVKAVIIADQTARLKEQLEQIKTSINQLQLEAKQREIEQTQQALEQLKAQLQNQIQNANLARQTAEAESAARQDAERALKQVASNQRAHLSAARKKTLQLNHEEAELTSGAKLPTARVSGHGEIFNLTSAAFEANGALTPAGLAQLKALSAYLKLTPKANVSITAFDTHSDGAKQMIGTIQQAFVSAGLKFRRGQLNTSTGIKPARRALVIVKI